MSWKCLKFTSNNKCLTNYSKSGLRGLISSECRVHDVQYRWNDHPLNSRALLNHINWCQKYNNIPDVHYPSPCIKQMCSSVVLSLLPFKINQRLVQQTLAIRQKLSTMSSMIQCSELLWTPQCNSRSVIHGHYQQAMAGSDVMACITPCQVTVAGGRPATQITYRAFC